MDGKMRSDTNGIRGLESFISNTHTTTDIYLVVTFCMTDSTVWSLSYYYLQHGFCLTNITLLAATNRGKKSLFQSSIHLLTLKGEHLSHITVLEPHIVLPWLSLSPNSNDVFANIAYVLIEYVNETKYSKYFLAMTSKYIYMYII